MNALRTARLWPGLIGTILALGCQSSAPYRASDRLTALTEATEPTPATLVSHVEDAPRSAPTAGAYQHSPDYTALVGQLHHNPRQETWRLRYAPVNAEDRYGGSVTLLDFTRAAEFKDGQFIRVEGTILNPERSEVSPAYQIRTIASAEPRP